MDPLAVEIAAVGGMDNCQVDIKNIFKHALLTNASCIICFHNHPSGDSSPSKEDFRITGRIKEAGELLGVSLMDHIIIGDGEYYSLRKMGHWSHPLRERLKGQAPQGRNPLIPQFPNPKLRGIGSCGSQSIMEIWGTAEYRKGLC